MKKKFYKFVLFSFLFSIGISFSLSSQTTAELDNFLENEIYGVFTSKFNKNIGGLYSTFYLNANIASDDAVFGGGANDINSENAMTRLDTFNLTADIDSDFLWIKYMKVIENCNNLLQHDDNTSARIIAEVKFIRAYSYFHLVRLFGGIPILTDYCTPLIPDYTRNTEAEVYTFMIRELTSAIDDLPVKSSLPIDEHYRATKGAAQTLLAKIYLYNEQWSEALVLSESIINSGEYALLADYGNRC